MKNKNIIYTLALLVILLVAGYGVYYKYFNNSNNMNQKTTEQSNKPQIEDLDPKLKTLKKKVIKKGQGRAIEKGDVAYVIYAGFLADGKVFDSNATSGKAIGFPIGVGAVIKGWDQGLLGAKEGEEMILDIPADMAYGQKGVPGRIPANSPLRFDILVVKVLSKEEALKLSQKQSEATTTDAKKSEAQTTNKSKK